MTSQPENLTPPEPQGESAPARKPRSRGSIASYLLRLLGLGRAPGRMTPLNAEPASPPPPEDVVLGGNPQASAEERDRRGEAFGTTHEHPDKHSHAA